MVLFIYTLVVTSALAYKVKKTLTFSIANLIPIFLISVFFILNVYSYYFYTNNINLPDVSFKLFLTLNFDFIKYLLLYILVLGGYLGASLSIGSLILDKIFKKIKTNTTLEEFSFVSLMTGLIIIGSAFFVFAALAELSVLNSVLVLVVCLVLNPKFPASAATAFIKKLTETKKWNLNIYSASFLLLVIIFLASTFVSIFRSFTYSPDGLRAYMNLTHYIAVNESIPTTKQTILSPFLTEITIAPAFMIGQIPLALAIMYSLAMFYILGFYLILKDIDIKGKKLWLLFPIILYPAFLQMYAGEFKVDVFTALFATTSFFTFYKYLKTKHFEFAPLTALFLVASLLSKMTAIYFAIPFGLYLLISIIIRFKSFKKFLILGLFTLFPIIPWIILYKISIPKFASIGLGLSSLADSTPGVAIANSCNLEIRAYEEGSYFSGFGPGILNYIKLPYHYLIATGTRANSFSLLDLGLLIFIPISIVLFWLIVKHKFLVKDKTFRIIIILSLLSLIPWLALTPVYTWYIAPIFLLIGFIFGISIYTNSDNLTKRIFYLTTMIVSAVYMLAVIMSHNLATYFPSNLSLDNVIKIYEKSESHTKTYYDSYIIAQKLNENSEDIIMFTSSAPFVNINYFIDKYYDRVIYFDSYSNNYDKKDLDEIIEKYNVKYIVLNKIGLDSSMECLKETQNIAKLTVENAGVLIEDTKTFGLYEVKF